MVSATDAHRAGAGEQRRDHVLVDGRDVVDVRVLLRRPPGSDELAGPREVRAEVESGPLRDVGAPQVAQLRRHGRRRDRPGVEDGPLGGARQGEPAAVRLDDGEGADEAAGAARLRVLLEEHEPGLGGVAAEHRGQDPQGRHRGRDRVADAVEPRVQLGDAGRELGREARGVDRGDRAVGLREGRRDAGQGAGDDGERVDVDGARAPRGGRIEPGERGLERRGRVEHACDGRGHVAGGGDVVAQHRHVRGDGPERAGGGGAGVVRVGAQARQGAGRAPEVEGRALPLERRGVGAHAPDDLLGVLRAADEDDAADPECHERRGAECCGQAPRVAGAARGELRLDAVPQRQCVRHAAAAVGGVPCPGRRRWCGLDHEQVVEGGHGHEPMMTLCNQQ